MKLFSLLQSSMIKWSNSKMLLSAVNSLPSLSLKDTQLWHLYQTPVFPHPNPSADEMRDDPTAALKSQREKLGISFSERVRWQKHSSCWNDALRISTSIWCSQEADSTINETFEDSHFLHCVHTSQWCQRRPILKVLFAKPETVKYLHSIDCLFRVMVL